MFLRTLGLVFVLAVVCMQVAQGTGRCPPRPSFGPCVELCPPEGCTSPQLCCSNGCGHECYDPVYTGR